ncbi:hypothetical protein P7H62_06870 [Vagococcus carniphilus]|uniref:ECF transporter S component n=1 Tax=Vagococcus carniphilus TaxID=218144 RepID=A0AAW8U1B4_9ENTE|nr:hypothetical protein [Vagococcus carniphilus]MDT2831142.1 hypothetical protein [Vagococcus carniphilus]MDT2833330.1 hypothetical protein [Vagococcus carniphilus]MDT2839699.1 hypothetical protein [Vagococcus carniphilus]MDT2854168.1 hypothetical protein [Vagococcus carniphilus]
MEERKAELKVLTLCAIAVAMNVMLGTFVAFMNIPLVYLSGIGTIFIAVNFKMKYGVLTGFTTHLLLAIIHGPSSLAFGLSSMVNAIVANLCSRRKFDVKQAIITGILVSLIGSFVSVWIRLILYGGFSNSITDVLILAIRSSGVAMFFAAYIGAVTDSIIDKILSCLLVMQLSKLPQLQKFFISIGKGVKE